MLGVDQMSGNPEAGVATVCIAIAAA